MQQCYLPIPLVTSSSHSTLFLNVSLSLFMWFEYSGICRCRRDATSCNIGMVLYCLLVLHNRNLALLVDIASYHFSMQETYPSEKRDEQAAAGNVAMLRQIVQLNIFISICLVCPSTVGLVIAGRSTLGGTKGFGYSKSLSAESATSHVVVLLQN
jgi:hypothetical protein